MSSIYIETALIQSQFKILQTCHPPKQWRKSCYIFNNVHIYFNIYFIYSTGYLLAMFATNFRRQLNQKYHSHCY